MITIKQQPDIINYSLSLPPIVVELTYPELGVGLYKGSELIIDEVYRRPPVGENLVLKFDKIVDMLLSGDQPDYNSPISIQENIIADFRVELIYDGDAKNIEFKAIKGFVRRQPFDVSGFLRDNWLNLVPQVSEVTYHQPFYLTVYPSDNVMAVAKARMKDGTDKTVELGTMSANQVQSVNLNPGRMIQVLGGDYQYFDVYTVQGSVIRNGYKRFYFSDRFVYNADTFFYLNRLGGWDTLVLIGERQDQNTGTISTGLFDEFEKEFNQVPTYAVQKNSGFIRSEEHRRQCIDFLYSTQRYHLHEGALRPIVLSNPEFNKVRGELSSFNFTYRYSDTKVAYPELGLSPYQLIIE